MLVHCGIRRVSWQRTNRQPFGHGARFCGDVYMVPFTMGTANALPIVVKPYCSCRRGRRSKKHQNIDGLGCTYVKQWCILCPQQIILGPLFLFPYSAGQILDYIWLGWRLVCRIFIQYNIIQSNTTTCSNNDRLQRFRSLFLD